LKELLDQLANRFNALTGKRHGGRSYWGNGRSEMRQDPPDEKSVFCGTSAFRPPFVQKDR